MALVALLLQVLSLLQTQMVSILLRVECQEFQDARTQSISSQLLTLLEPYAVDTVYTVDSTVEAFDIIHQSCVYKTMSAQ